MKRAMKLTVSLLLFFFAQSAFGQTTDLKSAGELRQLIDTTARRERVLLLTEPYLDKKALTALYAFLAKNPLSATLKDSPKKADDFDTARYGKFVVLRKTSSASSGAMIPCITLGEGKLCVQSLSKALSPYLTTINFAGEKPSQKRLVQLFESSDARVMDLNSQEVSMGFLEKKRIDLSQLSGDELNFVRSFVYWRYLQDLGSNLQYIAKQYNILLRDNPKFCFMDRAGVATFGYTTANTNSPEQRALHVPLSHPNNILFYDGGYAIQLFRKTGSSTADTTDPTTPNQETVEMGEGRSHFFPASVIKPENVTVAKLNIEEALEDKEVCLFGKFDEKTLQEDSEDFARSLAFLYDLTIIKDKGGARTIRLRRPKTATTAIDQLPETVREIVMESVCRAVESSIARGTEMPSSLKGAFQEKLASQAIGDLRVKAVRRLRAVVEPKLNTSSNKMAAQGEFDREQRNLMSFITLCMVLQDAMTIVYKPVPEFIQRFNEVALIRTVSGNASNGGKFYNFFIGVPGQDGEVAMSPSISFPVE